MNEDEDLTDEQVDELLDNIAGLLNNLIAKAEAAHNQKKSLPEWLHKLLRNNKPSNN